MTNVHPHPHHETADLGAQGSASAVACEQGADHAQEAAVRHRAAWCSINKDERNSPGFRAGPNTPALAGCSVSHLDSHHNYLLGASTFTVYMQMHA